MFWVFLGVAETIVSSLLCCGVGIVQCLFNLLYYVIGVRNTKKPPMFCCPHTVFFRAFLLAIQELLSMVFLGVANTCTTVGYRHFLVVISSYFPKLWGWVAYIHKEEDEKRPLAKNQPVSKSKLVGRSQAHFRGFCMESSEHGAHISPNNLYKQADYWQVHIFVSLFWDLPI